MHPHRHEHIRRSPQLLAGQHGPINRHTVHRIVARIGTIAGIDDTHPHRLHHTLATQATKGGMRLETIVALLGHRSLEMTLVDAEIETRAIARLRHEGHARILGNGMCTRPVEPNCRMDTICEACAYFDTGPGFIPVPLRQRAHAHHQPERATLYNNLIERPGTPC